MRTPRGPGRRPRAGRRRSPPRARKGGGQAPPCGAGVGAGGAGFTPAWGDAGTARGRRGRCGAECELAVARAVVPAVSGRRPVLVCGCRGTRVKVAQEFAVIDEHDLAAAWRIRAHEEPAAELDIDGAHAGTCCATMRLNCTPTRPSPRSSRSRNILARFAWRALTFSPSDAAAPRRAPCSCVCPCSRVAARRAGCRARLRPRLGRRECRRDRRRRASARCSGPGDARGAGTGGRPAPGKLREPAGAVARALIPASAAAPRRTALAAVLGRGCLEHLTDARI